jgi:hypothetical protein
MSVKHENPNITNKVRERMETVRQKNFKDMTTAEKLMFRGWEQKVGIVLPSSMGNIEFEVRMPLSAELERMNVLQTRLAAGVGRNVVTEDDRTQLETDADELYGMLADICLDASMDKEFFKQGFFTPSDIGIILREVLREQAERANDVTSFRKK